MVPKPARVIVCLKLPDREVLRYVSDEVAVDVDPFVQIDWSVRALTPAPEAANMRADGVWRSLVARLLWEQEVGGSNPLTPTN